MSETCTGILDWHTPNECKLRQFDNGVVTNPNDPLVPPAVAEEFDLRPGQQITANIVSKRPRRRSGKRRGPPRPVVESVVEIEGLAPEAWASRKPFEELTPIDPQPRMSLEYPGCPAACRLIDLFCPLGYGTRGLIVAPPKAGKTILLQNIATGIKHNHPDVEVVALLIDALDELPTDGSLEGVLRLLADHFPKLPKWVRVIVTSRDEKRYPLKADPLQIPDDKGALEDLWEVSAANGVSAVRAIHTILSYNYETAICAMCRGTTRNGSPVSAH